MKLDLWQLGDYLPQVIWHFGSIFSYITSLYVVNRLSANLYLTADKTYFTLTTPVSHLPVATCPQFRHHQSRKARVKVNGISPGVNHLFTIDNNLIR
jgi:hypothetical protein